MVDTVFSEEDTAVEDGSAESAEEDGEASVMDSGCDKSKDGFRTRRARDEEQKEEGNERGQDRRARRCKLRRAGRAIVTRPEWSVTNLKRTEIVWAGVGLSSAHNSVGLRSSSSSLSSWTKRVKDKSGN